MPPLDQAGITPRGASIQVRLYAEDPGRDFRPSSGLLTACRLAGGHARRDLGRERLGGLALLRSDAGEDHCHRRDPRRGARASCRPHSTRPRSAASRPISIIFGSSRRLDVLARGEMLTRTLQTFAYKADTIEVLAPGTQTTIQDWPGRLGYWAVGVPPSGPMDPLSFRLANRLVGNDEGAPAIEITLSGPTLQIQQRHGDLPRRRRACRDARRRARAAIGRRSPSRPGRC